jgi:DNA repair photolyase
MKGEVGVTITSVDDRISKMTEPGAPLPEKRLEALRRLTEIGIDTYALIGPVLSHLEGNEEHLVEKIAATGVKRVFIDSLNLRPQLAERLNRMNIRGSKQARDRIQRAAEGSGLLVFDVF